MQTLFFRERECWFKSNSYTIIFPMPDPELPNKSNKEKRDRLDRSFRQTIKTF